MNVWEFIGSYWWLVFPLGGILTGVAGGWARAVRRWDERRRKHKLELARIKYGNRPPVTDGAQGRGRGPDRAATAEQAAARRSEAQRLITEHQEIDQRWLSYELDLAKLIDFPVMSDMREPVTVEFHRAKRTADGLRPDDPARMGDGQALADYREAVREYAICFEIAEREAKRRRSTDFSPEERRTLERAKQFLALAEDSGATSAERQQAYRRTQHELLGLIAIPDATDDAVRQRIAGALDAPSRSARDAQQA